MSQSVGRCKDCAQSSFAHASCLLHITFTMLLHTFQLLHTMLCISLLMRNLSTTQCAQDACRIKVHARSQHAGGRKLHQRRAA